MSQGAASCRQWWPVSSNPTAKGCLAGASPARQTRALFAHAIGANEPRAWERQAASGGALMIELVSLDLWFARRIQALLSACAGRALEPGLGRQLQAVARELKVQEQPWTGSSYSGIKGCQAGARSAQSRVPCQPFIPRRAHPRVPCPTLHALAGGALGLDPESDRQRAAARA